MRANLLGRRVPPPHVDDNVSIAKTFNVCLGVALVGIIITVASFNTDSANLRSLFGRGVIFAVFAVVPLYVYYLVVSLEIKKTGASVPESSVDSVYYLGFLITLTTLLVSVISYSIANYGAKSGELTVRFIGMQFGLSLLATAVALWLRVTLVQELDKKRPGPEPNDVLNENLFKMDEASRRVAAALEDASSRFSESLGTSHVALTQQAAGIVEDARERLKEFVQFAAAEVSSTQRTIAETAASSVQTMSTNNAVLFAQTSGVIEEARTSLRDFVKAAALETSSSGLAKAVADVTASLGKAGEDLSAVLKSLDALQGPSAAAVGNLDALSTSVRRVSESATAVNETLGRIAAGSTALDFESVRAGLAQLGDRLQGLGASAASAEHRYVAASETAVGSMRAKTEDLTEATRRLSDAFISVADELVRSVAAESDRKK